MLNVPNAIKYFFKSNNFTFIAFQWHMIDIMFCITALLMVTVLHALDKINKILNLKLLDIVICILKMIKLLRMKNHPWLLLVLGMGIHCTILFANFYIKKVRIIHC